MPGECLVNMGVSVNSLGCEQSSDMHEHVTECQFFFLFFFMVKRNGVEMERFIVHTVC